MSYHALTVEEAKQYALKVVNLFPEDASLTVREIGDGNLNLVFHIKDEQTGKSIIFKQALPYARVVGESMPLTLDRARIENEVLVKQGKLCPDLVPQVYHYDSELALTIMEDLSDHVILRTGLIAGNQYPRFAEDIGKFLAHTLFYQSDFYLAPDVKKSLVAQFINPELCKITEDLVFTDPYYDAPTNNFNPLIQNNVEKIWQDKELKKEIAKLKYTFLTSAQALIHGDLHTGSVFVTPSSTKVIDPEFAYVGPMGFDIGAIIANFILNLAAQESRMQDIQQRKTYQDYLLTSIDQIWSVFEEEFRRLSLTESKEISLRDPAFIEDFIHQVKVETLGFAGCKILRRVIGLAPVADLRQIADQGLRAQAERLALYLGKNCILKRAELAKASQLSSELYTLLDKAKESTL